MNSPDLSPSSLNDLFTHILDKEEEIHDIYLDLRYSPKVTNTHHCPKNGVTNFSVESHLPKYYPGWYGRIWFTVYKQKKSKDYFTKYKVHTGTGGYGLYDRPITTIPCFKLLGIDPYSYGVKLFVDDFPTIKSASLLELNNDLNSLITIHVHKHN
jgi:hypothetical protein